MEKGRWHASPFSWCKNNPETVKELSRTTELARLPGSYMGQFRLRSRQGVCRRQWWERENNLASSLRSLKGQKAGFPAPAGGEDRGKGNISGMEFNLESKSRLNLEIREDTQNQRQSWALFGERQGWACTLGLG